MRHFGSLALALACLAGPAAAQTGTAYQAGLRVAEKRGYANAACYATIFAKHAVVVENSSRKRSWYAASTPAYNAEQRSRCGIDRLEDLAARNEARRSSAGVAGRPRESAYHVGLRVAAERGYSGSTATCMARTFVSFASPHPNRNGSSYYAVNGRSMASYTQELFRACQISR